MSESPTVPPTTTPTEMPVEPQTPKSNGKTMIPWILTLIFLGISGFLFYQNQKLTTPTKDSQPLPSQTVQQDPTADWQTYTDTVLGIQFKLPKQFEVLEQIGKEVAGDTGNQYCIHFVRTQSQRLIPRVEAGAGPCAGSGLVIGTTTTTYSAGREGGFGDMHGYSVNQNRYSALFVQGNTFEIPSSLVTEKTNAHGVRYIIITGSNSKQDMGGEEMSVPILGTPGEGRIGALVNLSAGTYPGFSMQLPIQSPEDTALFETILSTLQLNKNTSSIPAPINEVLRRDARRVVHFTVTKELISTVTVKPDVSCVRPDVNGQLMARQVLVHAVLTNSCNSYNSHITPALKVGRNDCQSQTGRHLTNLVAAVAVAESVRLIRHLACSSVQTGFAAAFVAV